MALQKRNGQLLKILLVASFLNGLCWAGLIPMWQTPDEQAHFAQVQNILTGRKNEVFTATTSKDIVLSEEYLGTFRKNGNNLFTYHPENNIVYTDTIYGAHENEIEKLPIQDRNEFVITEATGYPPLYYMLVAGVNRIFWNSGLVTRVFISRIATVLISTLAIYAVYMLAGEIFKNKFYSLLSAGLVSFQPMWRFAGSGVTSDAMMNLVYPLLIWCFIKFFKNGGRYYWWLVGIYAVAMMIKVQILLIVPLLILATIKSVLNKDKSNLEVRKFSIFVLFVMFLSVLIVAGNYLIPHFTLSIFEKLGFKELDYLFNIPSFEGFMVKIDFFEYWRVMAKELYIQGFPWYFGVYRWLSLTLPLLVYRIVKVVILISVGGWLTAGIMRLKGKRDFLKIVDRVGLAVILLSSLIYATGLLVWNFFYWSSNGYSFGIQGRYFFPNLPEHMVLLLTGFLLLPLRNVFKKLIATVLVSGMMVFNWYSLYFVSGSYYDQSSWGNFFLQASQYKPWFFKAPMLSVIIFLGIASSVWLLASLVKYNGEKYA